MGGRARGSLPFSGMIMVVLAQAGNMVVMKMAMSDGINKYTMAFYCNVLSSLVLLPCPFIISRRSGSCPPLAFPVLRKIFLLALVGCASQTSGYVGIEYSSPVLGTAMMNLIPAFTFILAIISRMEKVNWKSSSSQAKLVGTIASILGAFVVTLYKGPLILSSSSPPASVQPGLLSQQSNWILGGFLLAAEAFLIALAYIIQAIILKDYPVVLNIMFYGMFFQTIFSGLLSFVTVREPQSWILKVDMGLIAILYSALVANVFRVTLSTWCLKRTGPVYVSMFQPLGTVFAVGLGFIFLGEKLHIGRYMYSFLFSIEMPEPFSFYNQESSRLEEIQEDVFIREKLLHEFDSGDLSKSLHLGISVGHYKAHINGQNRVAGRGHAFFVCLLLVLCSLIGAIVIVMGFYGVVWAKSKEEEKTIESSGVEESLASSSDKIPLLRNKASSV